MKRLLLAFFVMAVLTAWGCKSDKQNNGVASVSRTEDSGNSDSNTMNQQVSGLPDNIKAKYADLAVKIECLKRIRKNPKKLREAMAEAFSESGISEKQYNYTVPRLKLKDTDFVEQLASNVSTCVKANIPPRPHVINPNGRYKGKFVTNGVKNSFRLDIKDGEASAKLLLEGKTYRMKGTVKKTGHLSVEYLLGKNSVTIEGLIDKNGSGFSGNLRAVLENKPLTVRIIALKVEKQLETPEP